MKILLILIPLALAMGCYALLTVLWALRARQHDEAKGETQPLLEAIGRPLDHWKTEHRGEPES